MLIVIVKATRKPQIVPVPPEANVQKTAEELFNNIKLLQKHNLASEGISIQLVEDEYLEQINKVEIGGLSFHKIPVVYQIGGY